MKTIILSFLLITSLGVQAQKKPAARTSTTSSTIRANTIDSSRANVSATFQMRDLLFLQGAGVLTPTEPMMKVLYDSVEAKIRRNPTQILTTAVAVPAVQARALIAISVAMRDRRFQPMYQHYVRINDAIRAAGGTVGKPYLLRILNEQDAADAQTALNFIEAARQRNISIDQ